MISVGEKGKLRTALLEKALARIEQPDYGLVSGAEKSSRSGGSL